LAWLAVNRACNGEAQRCHPARGKRETEDASVTEFKEAPNLWSPFRLERGF